MEDKNQNDKEPEKELSFFWGKMIALFLVLSAILNLAGIFIATSLLQTAPISSQGGQVSLFNFQWGYDNIAVAIVASLLSSLLLFSTAMGLIFRKKYGFYLIYIVIFLGLIIAGTEENMTQGIIEILLLFLVGKYFYERRKMFR